jgi:Protein of unknown function (DUF2971)
MTAGWEREHVTELFDPATLLCHYTRAGTAFEHILPSGMLLMNRYSKMRDPFESQQPMFHAATAWGGDGDAQMRLFWKLQAQVATSRDDWRLLSLTRGDDRPGNPSDVWFRCPWARARIWEQYADNHAGVCLVFDREAMVETLRRNLGSKGQYQEGVVQYTVGGFGMSDAASIALGQFNEDMLEDDVAIHVVRYSREFFFLKTDDWASEWEYRFVFREATGEPGEPEQPAEAHTVSFGDALRYVVVGERFPKWQLLAAERVAEQARAELRQMTWELGRPAPVTPRAKRSG